MPKPLEDDIEAISGMFEKLLSSGEATADAIVSGVAPGRDVETTTMVRKVDTLGSSLTGGLARIRTNTEDDQRGHDQRGHDRLADEDFRDMFILQRARGNVACA